MLLSTSTSATADYNWQGAGTGGNTATDPADPTTQWGNPANWEEGAVPGAGDSASLVFTNAGHVNAESVRVAELYVAGDTDGGKLIVADSVRGNLTMTGGGLCVQDLWLYSRSRVTGGELDVSGGLVATQAPGDVYYAGSPISPSWLVVASNMRLEVDGTTIAVTGDTWINDGVLALSEATVTAPLMVLEKGGISGAGMVAAKINADRFSTVASEGGELTLGDATRADGFRTAGTITVDSGCALTLQSLSFATLGSSTMISGGTLRADNGIYLPGGGTISGSGSIEGPVAAAPGSSIAATGDLHVGDATAFDGVDLDGRLLVGPHTVTLHDRNVAVLGSLTELAGGTLAAPNGLLLGSGDNLVGSGTITADLTNDGGALSPGNSVGTLTIAGDYTITNEAASLLVALGGTASGDFDSLIIDGKVKLSGTLAVALLEAYRPGKGDTFDILDWTGTLTGDFDTLDLPTLTGGLTWDTSSLLSDGLIAIDSPFPSILGDSTMDGFVDDNDLAVMLSNWNIPTPATWDLGDFTGDTLINDDDLAVLLGNWTGPPPPAGAAVPEPASLALLGLGALSVIRRRRE